MPCENDQGNSMSLRISLFQFVLIFLLSSCLIHGQDYKKSIGLRLGSPVSISYKTFQNESTAIEVFWSFKSYSEQKWHALSGAVQRHGDITFIDVEDLNWYYGAGVSVHFWSLRAGVKDENLPSSSIGFNGFLGLEYTFPNRSFTVSLDWIPTWHINGIDKGLAFGFGTLAMRYILTK